MTLPAHTTSELSALTIGRAALRQLHQSLLSRAPDQAIAILQETGYASGEGLVQEKLVSALRTVAATKELVELHAKRDEFASAVQEIVTNDLASNGLTLESVTISALGTGALAVDSPDWAEAEPGSAEMPMCFFSSGMLADVLGRISGETVAAMEVECRSRHDSRCRFLTATPDVLQRVYEEMTQGKSYLEALGS